MFDTLIKLVEANNKAHLDMAIAHFNVTDKEKRRISYHKMPDKLEEIIVLHKLGLPMNNIFDQLNIWE